MEDFAFSVVVLSVGLALHRMVLRAHRPDEWPLLNYGFIAHVVASFAQIAIYQYYYEGGDLLVYHSMGTPIADALRSPS